MQRNQAEQDHLGKWDQLNEKSRQADKKAAKAKNPLPELTPISFEELRNAKLTPRVIVPHYLYADVRMRIAAGGTGKTTLALYEAMQLALARSLWGNKPSKNVRTMIVTKEDRREYLVARLAEMVVAHDLTEIEVQVVLDNVRIYDLTDVAFRLSMIAGDVVEVNEVSVEQIVESAIGFAPDWVIFDPLVSFGVGEGRVNDAEQGLIESFRYIVNRLGCCTEGIHHTGKQNAKEKEQGQYAGRGGSALADGSRMVAVLNPVDPSEWAKVSSTPLGLDETGIVMSLPKLSYCGKQEDVYIRRKGYHFEHERITRKTEAQVDEAYENQVYQFIVDQYNMTPSRRYSKTEIVSMHQTLGISRDKLRAIATTLAKNGRTIYREAGSGKAGSHFEPIEGKKPAPDAKGEREVEVDETAD